MKSLFGQIKSLFLNGFLTLLPIVLTIALVKYLFQVLKSWLMPIYKLEPDCLQRIQHSEIVLVFAFILLVGAILKFFVISNIIESIESTIFRRIPLLRSIYFGIKQLTNAWSPHNKITFKHVVVVEFPRAGVYSIGFLTNEVPVYVSPSETQKFLSVFIPTTPNPTTGFYVMVPEHECKIVDLTRQEAMTIIISGGIIQPERFEAQE